MKRTPRRSPYTGPPPGGVVGGSCPAPVYACRPHQRQESDITTAQLKTIDSGQGGTFKDPVTGVTITLTAAQVQLWLAQDPSAGFDIVLSQGSGGGTTAPVSCPVGTSPVPASGTAGVRGRVMVNNGTVVADNGQLLRLDGMWIGPQTSNINTWTSARNAGHLNGIRIMTAYNSQGITIPSMLAMLDQAVANAKATGMYVLIDNHMECCTGQNIGLDSALWQAVASRYANDTNVFYELKNEPDEPANPASYVSYETAIYRLIRSAAPNTHIVRWTTDPVGASSNLLQYFSPGVFSDPNASFGFHAYGKSGNLTLLQPDILLLKQHFPVMTTELDPNVCCGQGRSHYAHGLV